jgi:single-stranded-DNA-specific exonuclease
MTGQTISLTGKKWRVRTSTTDGAAERLDGHTGIHPLVASILHSRGSGDTAAMLDFLSDPSAENLYDPFLLKGMDRAVERLLGARVGGEKILVHGDYDVDGVTAAVLTKRALDLTGFREVTCFIPHRINDGYGLGPSAVELATAEGCGLLIAVDCGTNDLEAVNQLKSAGIDVLILDHHLPGPVLPDACALVNPSQTDCGYPFKDLCSAGLAFKLAQALHQRLDLHFNAAAYASMAALGTVADLVPLLDENRLLVRLGLDHLRRPSNPGMRELLRVSGVEEGRAPTASQVGFRLAPRINAAGRLDAASTAARLFLTADTDEAGQIARQLDLLNSRRQHQERELVEQLGRLVSEIPDLGQRRILVLDGEEWPRGVIGIAASRMVETHHRPAVVISCRDGVGHGSCRSVPGFNITTALDRVGGRILDRFGGHAMAAGFTLAADKIGLLREKLSDYCSGELDPDLLVPRAMADIVAEPSELDRPLLDQLNRLEPFGMGNPRPVFLVRGLQLAGEPKVLKGQHLKIDLHGGGMTIEAIWWRAGHLVPALAGCTAAVDLLARLELNRWGGRDYVRLNVDDIRPATAPVG